MTEAHDLFAAEFTAVIFDMDGTLVDSTALVEREWELWAQTKGLNPGEVARFSHGRRTEDAIRRYLPEANLKAELTAFQLTAEALDQSSVKPIGGAVEFVSSIKDAKWAVVTSAPKAIAARRLAACGFPPPPLIISADDVSAGKPDPEGFLKACRQLGEQPQSCLVFEDAPAGVSAALAAGMSVIALRTTHPHNAFPGCIRIDDFRNVAATLPQSGQSRMRLRLLDG